MIERVYGRAGRLDLFCLMTCYQLSHNIIRATN